ELFDLHGFFEARRRVEEPIRLTAAGPAARSPDGHSEVLLVEEILRREDGGMAKRLRASIRNTRTFSGREVYLWSDRSPIDLAWGPTHAGFAVLRGWSDEAVYYKAIDLRTAN